MAVPATVDELLALVSKSGVICEKRLADYVREHQSVFRIMSPAQVAAALVRAGLITRFHAEVFLQGKCRGLFLGNYKVLQRLGSGGMTVVYLAEHRETTERASLSKYYPRTGARISSFCKRFYREARAAAVLDHPNIVRGLRI